MQTSSQDPQDKYPGLSKLKEIFKTHSSESCYQPSSSQIDQTQFNKEAIPDLIEVGEGLVEQDNFESALEHLQSLIAACYKHYEKKDKYTASCYEKLGRLYVNKKNFSEGIPNLTKAYQIGLELLDDGQSALEIGLCQILYSLALYHYEKDPHNQQNISILEHLEILADKIHHKEDILVGKIQFLMGHCHAVAGQSEVALQEYFKALEIYKMSMEEDHPMIGKVLNGIAYNYSRQGKWDEAIENYNKVLQIYGNNAQYGKKHRIYINAIGLLGSTYQLSGKYTLAIETLNEAIELSKEVFGDDSKSLSYFQYHLEQATTKLDSSEKQEQDYGED